MFHSCANITFVKARHLYPWDVSPSEAAAFQSCLAPKVDTRSTDVIPRLVAGVDISGVGADGLATGAAIVLSYPGLSTLECRVVRAKAPFPYVPGLLSFRESPVVAPVLESLTLQPDVLLVDGHGIAHPRRFGIACHLGLLFDIPAIGCAKSRLVGRFEEPGWAKGSHTDLKDREEVIGAALRTRDGTRPIFVSVGHKLDLESALQIVMGCSWKYRIPEPTRQAHLAAAGRIAPFGPAKQC